MEPVFDSLMGVARPLWYSCWHSFPHFALSYCALA